jgi:hypothetical protein
VNYNHRCPKGNRQMRRILNQAANALPTSLMSAAHRPSVKTARFSKVDLKPAS